MNNIKTRNAKQIFFEMSTSSWGFFLVIGFPILNAFIYCIYINIVDIEWVNYSILIQSYDPQTAKRILARVLDHSNLFHFGKMAFWPVVLCQLKILLIAIFTVAIAQFFNSRIEAKRLFLMSLWSHITLLVGMLLSLAVLVTANSPVRIYLKDLDPISWNSLLKLKGDGALQFFTSFEGPIVFVNIFILAYLFKRQSNLEDINVTAHIGWIRSILFAAIPYFIFMSMEYYLFGVAFSG
ncbi:hypothetical protein H8K52_14925 [Undibacterium seohonense]|uniref:Yip1 domain-containing protein n=1 Tax=Undibacterium seohonense TaxID=1344950 RepID=A0ABR6X6Y2_9BURK|nr:hypothetical protein [Undibacterium seohonense]MBC3808637.1 hypothetical protein [Undibacterium seohonense]